MKRSLVSSIICLTGAREVFDLADLPPEVRSTIQWVYRVLLNASDFTNVGGMASGALCSLNEPASGGLPAPARGVAIPWDGNQIEIPIHRPELPALNFIDVGGTDWLIGICIEYDDGTEPPAYQRRTP